MSADDVFEYTIRICNACMDLRGEMCHTPECVFCRRTMKEVGRYLDALLIRPVIDGERLPPPKPAASRDGRGEDGE